MINLNISFSAHGVDLVQTCGACPEQYDAYIDGEEVGYLRLRHGYFSVDYKDAEVYSAYPDGDGCFTSNEREYYLQDACEAIAETHKTLIKRSK